MGTGPLCIGTRRLSAHNGDCPSRAWVRRACGRLVVMLAWEDRRGLWLVAPPHRPEGYRGWAWPAARTRAPAAREGDRSPPLAGHQAPGGHRHARRFHPLIQSMASGMATRTCVVGPRRDDTLLIGRGARTSWRSQHGGGARSAPTLSQQGSCGCSETGHGTYVLCVRPTSTSTTFGYPLSARAGLWAAMGDVERAGAYTVRVGPTNACHRRVLLARVVRCTRRAASDADR
jgi:hypothetical protein